MHSFAFHLLATGSIGVKTTYTFIADRLKFIEIFITYLNYYEI
jgi:hypothetical protein